MRSLSHHDGPADVYQHPSAKVIFDRRDPPVLDPYPPPSVVEQAKADMLCERADLLDKLDAAGQATVLLTMDKPTYYELQAIESRHVETVADDAAMLLYARTLDGLDRPTQQRLRDNAAVFVRSQHDAWVKHALDMAVLAVEELLASELHRALPNLTTAHWHGHAVRCAGLVYGAMRSALASTNGMPPGTYLRIAGHCTAEDINQR